MPHVARLLVLSAFALVACGYAASPVGPAAPIAGGTVVVRSANTAAVRTDVQHSREAAPSSFDLFPTHRACAAHRGASC
jgi:hypothetical protein